jgi:para-aminobenzoate synthetase/4-amino-4-deoxychorismate lyase
MQILIEFEKNPLLFSDPVEIIRCHRLDEIKNCFEKIENAIKNGFYLAGFLSYEAGYSFEESLKEEKSYDFPLLQFGVYTSPLSSPPKAENSFPSPSKMERGVPSERSESRDGVRVNISYPSYSQNINTIRYYIEAGDTYQITYCLKFKFDYDGDPYSLYRKLKKEQPVPYPTFIKTDEFSILSLSPEMFIKKNGGEITTKPMKGTWMRGKTLWDDLLAKRRLHLDPKNRAENVMIADLLRNDLGKISEPGTVLTPKLFEVARYKTLCQMTSTVRGKIDPNIKLYDIFKALHPSGSVTGAPKIISMKIIKELEKEERKIYTGTIGYITPQRDMFFNIPIRTLLIKDGAGEMGIGGGIVWDSTPEGEWEECQIKAGFLINR